MSMGRVGRVAVLPVDIKTRIHQQLVLNKHFPCKDKNKRRISRRVDLVMPSLLISKTFCGFYTLGNDEVIKFKPCYR